MKERNATSQENVVLYKNKLDGRMCTHVHTNLVNVKDIIQHNSEISMSSLLSHHHIETPGAQRRAADCLITKLSLSVLEIHDYIRYHQRMNTVYIQYNKYDFCFYGA